MPALLFLCSPSAPLRSLLRPQPHRLGLLVSQPGFRFHFGRNIGSRSTIESQCRTSTPMAVISLESGALLQDAVASAVASGVALALLRFWEEMAKRGVFEQKMNRKLVHISVGLVFLLFWPLFSSSNLAPFLAALAPGVNAIRMLLLGLGVWKNDAIVKSMSRQGDYRELLKGPLYYACTITLATTIFWRTSPIAVSAICNLCAGDGFADIIGRMFGKHKLPYNPSKSFAGTIAMAASGFLASILYMHFFALFGYIEESWSLVLAFFIVSAASAMVESLPISSELDDNLTVPLTSLCVGAAIF
ncbi:probable phytol kinase 2, chloroplastic [Phalaenopsis equestris]|uniref:probable phytol kinase 2, chloroplastic n=1 Tax=Phalaenopsis equestris TaxID=78828 RepID=UPI0009E31795|nr:probable phytol kinase 2, chloroplastic [Phalaenopsis equestris]